MEVSSGTWLLGILVWSLGVGAAGLGAGVVLTLAAMRHAITELRNSAEMGARLAVAEQFSASLDRFRISGRSGRTGGAGSHGVVDKSYTYPSATGFAPKALPPAVPSGIAAVSIPMPPEPPAPGTQWENADPDPERTIIKDRDETEAMDSATARHYPHPPPRFHRR